MDIRANFYIDRSVSLKKMNITDVAMMYFVFSAVDLSAHPFKPQDSKGCPHALNVTSMLEQY